MVIGRESSKSLYDDAYSTFEKDEVYNQKDAEGFIRLNALRLVIAGKKQNNFDLKDKRLINYIYESLYLK